MIFCFKIDVIHDQNAWNWKCIRQNLRQFRGVNNQAIDWSVNTGSVLSFVETMQPWLMVNAPVCNIYDSQYLVYETKQITTCKILKLLYLLFTGANPLLMIGRVTKFNPSIGVHCCIIKSTNTKNSHSHETQKIRKWWIYKTNDISEWKVTIKGLVFRFSKQWFILQLYLISKKKLILHCLSLTLQTTNANKF